MNLLWTGFLMGLAGSFHCIAMCGPLVAGFSGNNNSGVLKAFSGKLTYNTGRIFSYTLIGLIFGALGQVISLFAYQQSISILAGILLLIWAVSSFGIIKLNFQNKLTKSWPKIASNFYQKLRNYPKPLVRFGSGMVNGFLPCGLVYVAATASIHEGKIGYSMLYMLFFGLGTLPAMLGISVLINSLKAKWRMYFSKAVPYFTFLIAVLFIVRGLALNIPYLSPKIAQTAKGQIENSCCHKK